jgi:predicted dehydrogenase
LQQRRGVDPRRHSERTATSAAPVSAKEDIMRTVFYCAIGVLFAGWSAVCSAADKADGPIRVGMIGLDTSHVIAFSGLMNDPAATGDLADVQVVAGYPGGSPDLPASRDRVQKYTEQLRGQGIEIVDSIDELLGKVDAVMLMSVDGRPHLEQARPVIAAGKRLYIDKPFAGSLADALEIVRLAKQKGMPLFSSSSTRFSSGVIGLRGGNDEIGQVRGCAAFSPCSLEEHHPDLFWYGVHGVEILFTIMGPGCRQVTRVHTDGTDLAVGVWDDGRVGSFRGIRDGKADYGATVYGTKGIAMAGRYEGYKPLVVEIARYFKTGKPPIPIEETLEIFAFMEAADESKREGGRPVSLEEVVKAAEARAARPPVEIAIDRDGKASLRGQTIPVEDLGQRLVGLDLPPETTLIIRADKACPYARLSAAIDACAKEGFKKLVFCH